MVVTVISLNMNMNDNKVLYAASFGVVASLATLGALRWWCGGNQLPYPPGPKGYPLIGSLLGVPQDVPIWQAFSSIAQKYSKWWASSSKCVTQGAATSRHRCAVHENVFKGIRRLE